MLTLLLQKTTVHVSATTERLLYAAELMELKKPYADGLLREITMDDIDNFKNAGKSFSPPKNNNSDGKRHR